MNPAEINLLFKRINDFSELLKRKGYDGIFYDPFGFVDPVKDSITKHVVYSFQAKGGVDKITLMTDTERKHSDSLYVRFNFETDYTLKGGFKVANMNIVHRSPFGNLRSKDIALTDNEQIPEKSEATNMVLEQKRSRGI